MIELLYFAAIFLSAASLGKKLLDNLKLKLNFLETAVFSSAIGFGVLSYATLILGLIGLLYKSTYLILIAGALALSVNEIKYFITGIKNLANKARKLKAGINLILITILLMFIILNLIASLSPPYLWDEVAYNIALPKIYARHHQIIPTYDDFRSNYPFNINMLFTAGIVIANASLSKLFMFAHGTLLAAAIFAFARRYFSLRSALFAALAYYTMPMVSNHISSTYTDIGVAFYIFTAYYVFYLWIESGKTRWLLLSAVMAGLSLASKHTALYYLPIFLLGIAYRQFFIERGNFADAIKKFLYYLAIVFLLASPWYIKSYIYTGNPVFPFANSFFGGKFGLMEQDSLKTNFLDAVGERTFPNFLLKFWDLTMHSSKYGMLLGFGAVFLAFVPLIFFIKKTGKAVNYLLAYSLIAIVIWFFGPQVIRYLMIYPMLAIISGVAIDSMLEMKNLNYLVIFILLSALAFNLSLWYGANSIKLPYAFGLESEQSFYEKLKDENGYAVFRYANENLPKTSKLLLFREFRGYLSDLDYIIGDPLLQKIVDYSKFADGEDMYNELKKLGITHIFINTKIESAAIHNINQPARYTERHIALMDEALRDHGNLLFDSKGIYLYELK